MQFVSQISLEMFLNITEETPHEKRFLSGDSKPSSGMALAVSGLTEVGYGHKQICSQIRRKHRLSFNSTQYTTLRMERRLTICILRLFPAVFL